MFFSPQNVWCSTRNALEIDQWVDIDRLVTTTLESLVTFNLVLLSVGICAAVLGELHGQSRGYARVQLRVNVGVGLTIQIELIENS